MNTGDARTEIMGSIRAHLAESARHEGTEEGIKTDPSGARDADLLAAQLVDPYKSPFPTAVASVVDDFKRNLEAVDGHCLVVRDNAEAVEVVQRIAHGKEIAVSNAQRLKELIGVAELTPPASRLFHIDVGVTTAQAGIAETGTLVLDSSVEHNRLISLVPPVHIAILDAARIYATLGETLAMLQNSGEVSPAITFITGPSRTADIELTLAIGVHGPQELYVIIIQDQKPLGADN